MNADHIETLVGGGRGQLRGQSAVGSFGSERVVRAGEIAAERTGDSEAAVRQYSRAQVVGIWAAAAGPMGVLAWVVAPWLADRLGGAEPLAQALLLLLTAGLIWQSLLVLILARREVGTLRWTRLREALWLRAPRDPGSGRAGGRVWLWVIPFLVIFGLETFVPGQTGPLTRDFGVFLGDDRGQAFFDGAWGWFAVVVVLALFNTVLGEELLFRGLLLPRMRGAFGRWDWVANGVLFATYHLHMPWVIPTVLLDAFALSYPSRRFRSAWMGIVVHSVQSLVVIAAVLAAVLG
jgi:membrane protease YdiL (CAAX protease family)